MGLFGKKKDFWDEVDEVSMDESEDPVLETEEFEEEVDLEDDGRFHPTSAPLPQHLHRHQHRHYPDLLPLPLHLCRVPVDLRLGKTDPGRPAAVHRHRAASEDLENHRYDRAGHFRDPCAYLHPRHIPQ